MSLFSLFPNQWTPVLHARDLKAAPVQVTVAGERVALFRGADGVAALIDRCPHRGVALSLGKVVDGCLECPFHAWSFRGDGEVASIPFNPDLDRGRIRATAVPVRERGGLVWLYTGLEAQGEPVVPAALTDPGFSVYRVTDDWDCHWTRAMENMLDSPHVPFLHRKTIGRFVRPYMTPDSKMTQEIVPTEHGFEILGKIDDRPSGKLIFTRPNGMSLDTIPKGPVLRIHVWCVPIDARRTRMILAVARNFGQYNPLVWWFDRFNDRVLAEDRAVVESSDPPEVPPASEEVNVPTDKPTLRFRTWYLKTFPATDPTAPSAARQAAAQAAG